MLRSASLLTLSLAFALPLAAADKAHRVEIKEWPIPWAHSAPRDPHATGPDRVWFVGATGNYLGSFNPQTQRFSRIDLLDEPAPRGLIAAAGVNGMLWYASSAHGYIARFDPVSRTIARFSMPNAAASDPSELAFEAGERNIWFTARDSNIVGRLRLVNGIVDLAGLNTPKALPEGVAMAPNAGNPWFALSGTNKLATIDARTFTLTEYSLTRAGARPQRIAFTNDGRLWFTDTAEGYIGAFTPPPPAAAEPSSATASASTARSASNSPQPPATSAPAARPASSGAQPSAAVSVPAYKEWALPGGKASRPMAIAVDAHDRLWIMVTGTKPATLVGFDPKTERFFSSTPLPSGNGSVPDMSFDKDNNQLWFATESDTIGYARLD